MVKKIIEQLAIASPKKNFSPLKSQMPFGYHQNNFKIDNMMNISDDNKKPKTQNQCGTRQTETNLEVEQERNQTFVNQFDVLGFTNQDGNIINAEDSKKINLQRPDDIYNQQMGQYDVQKMKKDCSKKENTEYVKFFKFYYDKTRNEHPKWTPAQITKIVALLWQKKKFHQKNPCKPSTVTSRRSNKPLTAKDAFKADHKNLKKEELDQIWAKLPKESKMYWKGKGMANVTVSARSSDVGSVNNSKKQFPAYNSMRNLLRQV